MVRHFGIATGVLLLLSVTSAPAEAIQGQSTRFSSCAKVLEVFSTGVSKDKRAQAKAVALGFERPRISPAVYRTNSGRLDRDGNGTLCEQVAIPEPEPGTDSTPPAPSAPLVWSATDSATWSQVEADFIRYQTERIKTLARADVLWICNKPADPAYDGFTRGFYQDRADEGVRRFGIDASHARQMMAPTGMVCATSSSPYTPEMCELAPPPCK